MTYRIVVTARARADVVTAFRWIAEQSPDAATRWYAGLQKAIGKLNQLPGRNPVAEEESEQVGITLRQMFYGRRPNVFRILYSVEDDTIVLHYVRHSAQGPIEP
jgi:plasmid stabilization system protein ParE